MNPEQFQLWLKNYVAEKGAEIDGAVIIAAANKVTAPQIKVTTSVTTHVSRAAQKP